MKRGEVRQKAEVFFRDLLTFDMLLGFIIFVFLLLNSLLKSGGTQGPFYPPFECDLSLFHYTLIKAFAANEGIVNTWWLRMPTIPQLEHSLFLTTAQCFNFFNLRSDIAPGFVNVTGFIMTGVLVRDFFKNSSKAIWYLIVMLAFPIVRWNVASSYLDVFTTFFCTFSIVLLIDFIKEKKVEYLGLSLTLAMFAFSSKYFAGVFLAPIFLIALVFCLWNIKEYLPSMNLKHLIGLLLIGFVVLSVFLYQNYKLSHNPIFPFFSKFDTPNEYLWTKESSIAINGAIEHWKLHNGIKSVLSVYKSLLLEPDRFADTPGFLLGHFWLIFYFSTLLMGVYLYCKKIQRRLILALGIFSIVTFYAWLYSSPVYRYLQPQISILVIFFLVSLNLFSNKTRYTLTAFLSLSAFFFIGDVKINAFEKFPITKVEVENYSANSGYGHKTENYINANTKEGEVVLNVFAGCYGLYMKRPMIGDWFGPDAVSFFINKKPEELKVEYSKRDVSYVVFDFKADNIKQAFGTFEKIQGDFVDCFTHLVDLDSFSIYKFNRNQAKCFDPRLVEKRISYLQKCSARQSEIFK
jgi:hypothetical protein